MLELPPELPLLLLLLLTSPVRVVAFCVACDELSKLGLIVFPLALLALELPAIALIDSEFSEVAVVSLWPASWTLMVQEPEVSGGHTGGVVV